MSLRLLYSKCELGEASNVKPQKTQLFTLYNVGSTQAGAQACAGHVNSREVSTADKISDFMLAEQTEEI